jgi:membrane peptidoglycan carboxypeptidase
LLKPRILSEWMAPDGSIARAGKPEVVRRVVSKPVAHLMANLLEGVVDHGTAKTAAIPGVRIAGKTGTAHKTMESGRGYARNDYIASFVGFFPANAPQYLIFVMLENPRTTYWGGFVAAPTFQRIAQRLITATSGSGKEQKSEVEEITDMPTTDTRMVVVPDVTGRSAAISAAILEKLGLEVEHDGDGDFVLNQNPAPGARVEPHATITLNLFEMAQSRATAPGKMPNLIGLSAREALQKTTRLKLDAFVQGSGRVVRQHPGAGAPVSPGMRCEIECQATLPAVRTTVVH